MRLVFVALPGLFSNFYLFISLIQSLSNLSINQTYRAIGIFQAKRKQQYNYNIFAGILFGQELTC